ncbi:MAG: HslU--HslV peptidase ATPase subunit, partial [Firmicutes bacterium]|nr:HslU--HslV peptidase ATPase subunit [Bacillota bacterium]
DVVEQPKENNLDVSQGGTISLGSIFGDAMPKKTKRRKMKIKDARKILIEQEAANMIDMDQVTSEALENCEQNGIIFIDEIDKIASGSSYRSGADVSREGVQRDILPIVEGSVVNTKYGPVKTDHVLFIGAGAFHVAKPTDLIPELQGRFPIRVELENLTQEDFKRILTEPDNALLKQHKALLETENVSFNFTDEAAGEIARMAFLMNEQTENIGARRLHTIMEKLLEDIAYDLPDPEKTEITIDADYVREKFDETIKAEDIDKFIL